MNFRLFLISDITFTTKGVILVQHDSDLIGVAGDRVVLKGVRDNSVLCQQRDMAYRLHGWCMAVAWMFMAVA